MIAENRVVAGGLVAELRILRAITSDPLLHHEEFFGTISPSTANLGKIFGSHVDNYTLEVETLLLLGNVKGRAAVEHFF